MLALTPLNSSVEGDNHPSSSLPPVAETNDQPSLDEQEITEELNESISSKGSDRAVRKSIRNRKKPERFGQNVYD